MLNFSFFFKKKQVHQTSCMIPALYYSTVILKFNNKFAKCLIYEFFIYDFINLKLISIEPGIVPPKLKKMLILTLFSHFSVVVNCEKVTEGGRAFLLEHSSSIQVRKLIYYLHYNYFLYINFTTCI